jgi:hypothetical protein
LAATRCQFESDQGGSHLDEVCSAVLLDLLEQSRFDAMICDKKERPWVRQWSTARDRACDVDMRCGPNRYRMILIRPDQRRRAAVREGTHLPALFGSLL